MSAITTMHEHSDVKVKLYENYLSIYLNVISRSHIKKIYLYDLFCGEGIYDNMGKGSPIVTMECIKEHYFSNKKTCPDIVVVFNDTEESEIEPGKFKIDRVKEHTANIYRPESVKVFYTKIDYTEIVARVIKQTSNLGEHERALIFIDPWGYKEIQPNDLKQLMNIKKVEVLLFLPIYFMYRFANKALLAKTFPGGRAIRNFLDEVYGSEAKPYFKNQQHFISELHFQLKKYLNLNYVDVFKIERGNNNWFGLFFFTNNRTGFWKMLDAKWKIDPKHGEMFKQEKNDGEMFDQFDISCYKDTILNYLKNNPSATNNDLLELGLQNNFLPKGTLAILKELHKIHPLEITSLDGKAAQSYYIGNEDRLVNIKLALWHNHQ